MLCEPGVEPVRDAVCLRHSTNSRRPVHHSLALGDGELAEQEEPFTGCRRDPIRISTAGVQEYGLGCPGRFLSQADKFILDLEWTKGLEFPQRRQFRHDSLLFTAIAKT